MNNVQHSSTCSAHRGVQPDEQEGIVGGKDGLDGVCHLVQARGLHGSLDPSRQVPAPVVAQHNLQADMQAAREAGVPSWLQHEVHARRLGGYTAHKTGQVSCHGAAQPTGCTPCAAGGSGVAGPAEGTGLRAMHVGMQSGSNLETGHGQGGLMGCSVIQHDLPRSHAYSPQAGDVQAHVCLAHSFQQAGGILYKPLQGDHSTSSGLFSQHMPARHASPCKVFRSCRDFMVTQALAAVLPATQPRNPGAHINNGCGDGL